jgi:predicted RNA-binding protein YlxR (DUF448 family)
MQASSPSQPVKAAIAADNVSLRKCIVTGRTAEKSDLIRFVTGPDGQPVADLAEKLPGRGAWVTALPAVISEAAQKGRFKRHIDATSSDPTQLVAIVTTQIERRLLQHLSLFRRAGLALCGGGTIREVGFMQALLIADNASTREARQLISAVQPEWTETGLPAELLGQAAGRGSVAYVGIIPVKSAADRRMCDQLRNMITRWRHFSGYDGQYDKMEQK